RLRSRPGGRQVFAGDGGGGGRAGGARTSSRTSGDPALPAPELRPGAPPARGSAAGPSAFLGARGEGIRGGHGQKSHPSPSAASVTGSGAAKDSPTRSEEHTSELQS